MTRPAAPLVAAGMGFDSWEAFSGQLKGHMERVHMHFHDLLAPNHPIRKMSI
jgi:glutamine synthetase adenylyltransferase